METLLKVVTVQSVVRAWHAKRLLHQMKKEHDAALCIQRHYRYVVKKSPYS